MFGLRPMWFHMTNIFLHAAACVLFTRVCTVVAGLRRNFAVIAGILFAVHPVHTEAVSLILLFNFLIKKSIIENTYLSHRIRCIICLFNLCYSGTDIEFGMRENVQKSV